MRTKILRTFAVTALVFAVSAIAQDVNCPGNPDMNCVPSADTAYVPFVLYFEGEGGYPGVINDYLQITARRGNTAVSISVTPAVQKILAVPLGVAVTSSVLNPAGRAQGRANIPAITNSRGNITLRLPPQAYQNAEIALHSVNGRRILRGSAAASEMMSAISRRNIAAGVYLLSVKGINGNAFTARLTHRGGNMNINVAFGGGSVSPERKLAKSAEITDEEWTITVSDPLGAYYDSTYTLNIGSGQNPQQAITLSRQYQIDMATVEGGTFLMGCNGEDANECEENELWPRQVQVGGFYISKYEVTQGLWKKIMGNNPSSYISQISPDVTCFLPCDPDGHPVENVSWEDAQEFINRLNKKTHKTYRLPTEAEWEFAARGGNSSAGYKYSGSNDIQEVAWYNPCHYCDVSDVIPSPHMHVGIKAPNELGIYDMSGNVAEWVNDWYGQYPQPTNGCGQPQPVADGLNRTRAANCIPEIEVNPQGPASGEAHVIRGGSWADGARQCRVTARWADWPGYYFNGQIGFRLVHDFTACCPPPSGQ